MKITDEAVEAEFLRWWKASKYCQVILPQPHLEQYARDGFRAAVNALSPVPVGVTEDDLINRLRYRVNNPSAWPVAFDQEGSDLFEEAANRLEALAPHEPARTEKG